MKVIAKISIIDRIFKEFAALRASNREPECVVLTREEYEDVMGNDFIRNYIESNIQYWKPVSMADTQASFVTREFKLVDRGYNGPEYLRVASHEKIGGVPLFVVNAAYHPK